MTVQGARRRVRVDRLSWRLGLSVALLVSCALAAGVALFYHRYYNELISTTRQHAERETWLIRQALEQQMLDKNRRLLAHMVRGFARDRTIQRVMILDRRGQVAHSSDPRISKRHFASNSPTCQVCHQHAPDRRGRSTVLEIDGGAVLRCVQPIPNRVACHGCHDAKHLMNGIIIVDVPLEPMRAALERGAWALALGGGVFALVLVLGIGFVFRRLVLRRLQRFEQAARAIMRGELDVRVPLGQHDALSSVEQQFNSMADSVQGLLERLREQQANLEKVMNSVDDGMVVLDRERRIVAVNDAFLRRFLGNGDVMIGKQCCDGLGSCFGHGVSCAGDAACPTLRCFSGGTVQMAIRTRILADGSCRQEEVRSSPVYSGGRVISHVVEVWRDITDRRSAEARLADYQRMVSLGMLASGFSHELNTPLSSIGTCLSGVRRLLGQGPMGPAGPTAEPVPFGGDAGAVTQREAIEEYVRIAQTQVERCGAITRHFLELARGKSLSRDIIDLPSCAAVVVGLCRHAAEEAGVKVEVQACQEQVTALANSSSVQQVLLNLLMNAIAASESGKTISVGCRHGEDIEVYVRDEGRGMGPEELVHVFEPFYSRRPNGTGLGLFVSMNLARAWGGDITVESTLGAGSTFRLHFPRQEGVR